MWEVKKEKENINCDDKIIFVDKIAVLDNIYIKIKKILYTYKYK